MAETSAGAAGLGLPAVTVLLAAMEAGVPVPVPFDLVLLVVGERAAAGALPVWLAALALEAVAIAGTTALLVACRGPGRAAVARLGPRLGLTEERLGRASAVVERRGRPALFVGRATPGLRTMTVLAAAGSGVSARTALVPLVAGSSVFLQLHLALGYALGPMAGEALERARGPAIAVLVILVVGGVAAWVLRRGRRAGAQAATEACCPACLALGMLVPRAFGAEGL